MLMADIADSNICCPFAPSENSEAIVGDALRCSQDRILPSWPMTDSRRSTDTVCR
ncbi:hypothetical protein D3C72_2069670 [compost metagenome]